MGVTRHQATENRRTIVEASERLFRERGIDGVGLNELMRAAGFTQGGFYNHFKSKNDLAAAVVSRAMAAGNQELVEAIARPVPAEGNRLERQISHYLSKEHAADIECGCSIAGLAADVRRLGGEAQEHFASGLGEMFVILDQLVSETDPGLSPEESRRRAIALYSSLMGALVLSRAVQQSTPDLAAEILSSARHSVLQQVGVVAHD